MDTLDHKRRRPPTEELTREQLAQNVDVDYAAALGPDRQGEMDPEVTPVASRIGPPVSSGSPNTMELGLVALFANPG